MLHPVLELPEREGHGDLPLADAGKEDGERGAGVAALVEGDDEVVVVDLVLEEAQLGAQLYILTPNSFNTHGLKGLHVSFLNFDRMMLY